MTSAKLIVTNRRKRGEKVPVARIGLHNHRVARERSGKCHVSLNRMVEEANRRGINHNKSLQQKYIRIGTDTLPSVEFGMYFAIRYFYR